MIMLKIKINWTYYTDLIECPKELLPILDAVLAEFEVWIRKNNSIDREYLEDGTLVIGFSTEHIVDYLNEVTFSKYDNPARIIASNIDPESVADLDLYF